LKTLGPSIPPPPFAFFLAIFRLCDSRILVFSSSRPHLLSTLFPPRPRTRDHPTSLSVVFFFFFTFCMLCLSDALLGFQNQTSLLAPFPPLRSPPHSSWPFFFQQYVCFFPWPHVFFFVWLSDLAVQQQISLSPAPFPPLPFGFPPKPPKKKDGLVFLFVFSDRPPVFLSSLVCF